MWIDLREQEASGRGDLGHVVCALTDRGAWTEAEAIRGSTGSVSESDIM